MRLQLKLRRGTQRKEGFTEAETLEYLLRNDKLHDKIRGGVIWVDESRDDRRQGYGSAVRPGGEAGCAGVAHG